MTGDPNQTNSSLHHGLPTLRELGPALTTVTTRQRVVTLGLPFLCMAIYFTAAAFRWWPLAVLALVYQSFVTYGSTSHDLVHRTLGLPARLNYAFPHHHWLDLARRLDPYLDRAGVKPVKFWFR